MTVRSNPEHTEWKDRGCITSPFVSECKAFCVPASPRQPPSSNMSIIMVVDFVRTQIGPVHAHTSWLARSIFVYCGLLGKSQHRIMTFLEEKKKRKRAEKMNMMVLTFMMQTCLHRSWFAKMIWFVKETHDPNKQVNTSPTQQSFSASPLFILLLPSTILFLHTHTRSSVAEIINESVHYLSALHSLHVLFPHKLWALYEFSIYCRQHMALIIVVVLSVCFLRSPKIERLSTF